MEIRDAVETDREWIRQKLIESWGSQMVVLRGALLDTTDLPALIYGENEGVLHHRALDDLTYEIVTLEAFRQWRGIGTALVGRVAEIAQGSGLPGARGGHDQRQPRCAAGSISPAGSGSLR